MYELVTDQSDCFIQVMCSLHIIKELYHLIYSLKYAHNKRISYISTFYVTINISVTVDLSSVFSPGFFH